MLSPDRLMKQAASTAQHYMIQAVEDIDALFGTYYARQHPELVAAYMKVAATDFATGIFFNAIEQMNDTLLELVRK